MIFNHVHRVASQSFVRRGNTVREWSNPCMCKMNPNAATLDLFWWFSVYDDGKSLLGKLLKLLNSCVFTSAYKWWLQVPLPLPFSADLQVQTLIIKLLLKGQFNQPLSR